MLFRSGKQPTKNSPSSQRTGYNVRFDVNTIRRGRSSGPNGDHSTPSDEWGGVEQVSSSESVPPFIFVLPTLCLLLPLLLGRTRWMLGALLLHHRPLLTNLMHGELHQTETLLVPPTPRTSNAIPFNNPVILTASLHCGMKTSIFARAIDSGFWSIEPIQQQQETK